MPDEDEQEPEPATRYELVITASGTVDKGTAKDDTKEKKA